MLYIARYSDGKIEVTEHEILGTVDDTIYIQLKEDYSQGRKLKMMNKVKDFEVMSYYKEKATILLKGYMRTRYEELEERATLMKMAIENYNG